MSGDNEGPTTAERGGNDQNLWGHEGPYRTSLPRVTPGPVGAHASC